MVTKIDSVTNRFDHDHWMVNKMDLVVAIKFNRHPCMETEKGEKDNPPSTCFVRSQRWAIF
jgi:hypothetical protein